jgi:glycosyltransferase involved in cell wall biosynthesis
VLIQDNHINTPLFDMQMDVINTCTILVFNSKYIKDIYNINNTIEQRIIPLGIDFNTFYPMINKHPDVLPNSIIYIGSSNNYPKGFDVLLNIIKNSNYNFCLVMKDDFNLSQLDIELYPRVRVFNRVDSNMIRLLINSCIVGICTSYEETQHLSGIECAACNKPMIARAVGWYYDCQGDSEWGCIADDSTFLLKIQYVLDNIDKFNPRKYVQAKYSIDTCKKEWSNLIDTLLK